MPTNHISQVTSQLGFVFEIIDIYRTNRPKGLRKPYEYIDNKNGLKEFNAKVKSLIKPLKKAGLIQMGGLNCLRKKYGWRIILFVLTYAEMGITKTQWQQLGKDIQKVLTAYLGKDARLYIEPFSTNRKFEIQFETYVYTGDELGEK